MEVYREERTLHRPPAVAARTLFGDADCRERNSSHAAGLLQTRLVVDETDGTVTTSVGVDGVLALTVLAVVVAVAGVSRPALRVPSLWLCALVVLAPLVHLWPGVAPRPDAGRVTDRRITGATAPAYVATVGLLWISLRPVLGFVATLLCVSLLAVGLGSYAVAAGWRTASVSTLWLAVAGLLPLLVTVANLSLAAALLRIAADGRVAGAASAAVASASFALVVVYCWLVQESVQRATFAPLASTPVRAIALAGYLAVVTALCLAVLDLLPVVADGVPLPLVALLCLPLAIPVGGWLLDSVETALARYVARRDAERRTVAGAAIYVVDADRALVRAVPFPPCVLVSRAVIETLAADELAAVVAHEAHHLRTRDRLLLVAVAVASVPVGRNALAAFLDYPARELAADEHAAAVAGPHALVRALRRLETLETPSRASRHPLAAPYALLYGAAPDAASHPSVDDRVAAVTR